MPAHSLDASDVALTVLRRQNPNLPKELGVLKNTNVRPNPPPGVASFAPRVAVQVASSALTPGCAAGQTMEASRREVAEGVEAQGARGPEESRNLLLCAPKLRAVQLYKLVSVLAVAEADEMP